MSFNKEESPRKSKTPLKLDPQLLFQQFKPDLYFNSPKISNHSQWFIVAEQVVPASREMFWSTIRRWTLEPQFVIPPIEKAEIKTVFNNENADHSIEATDDPLEIIVRELTPKRKTKDETMLEKVQYFENDREARVVYEPMLAEQQKLPFYYPKVKAYSFVYEAALESIDQQSDTCSSSEDKQGLLKLEIIPCDRWESVVTESRMQYALKSIIHKLFKWCIQNRLGYKKKAHHDVLVPKDTYQSMYAHLKCKYGPQLVSNWTEKTDPKKFVYEDIAIASYLICLWKEQEVKTKRKPNFIDLGCGNGLLTFLLVSEGYSGYGVDIAGRKIWPALCQNTSNDMLRVEVLHPASVSYPDTEWLIGNHADELVPWIPIIASKSGENCKFLLIPCCFYGLDGTRSLSLPSTETVGKYRAYTDYIIDIAANSGFVCEEDYLRIPSTKNIAIVGRSRQNRRNEEFKIMIANAGASFSPRKTDREKEEERHKNIKKVKIEK